MFFLVSSIYLLDSVLGRMFLLIDKFKFTNIVQRSYYNVSRSKKFEEFVNSISTWTRVKIIE